MPILSTLWCQSYVNGSFYPWIDQSSLRCRVPSIFFVKYLRPVWWPRHWIDEHLIRSGPVFLPTGSDRGQIWPLRSLEAIVSSKVKAEAKHWDRQFKLPFSNRKLKKFIKRNCSASPQMGRRIRSGMTHTSMRDSEICCNVAGLNVTSSDLRGQNCLCNAKMGLGWSNSSTVKVHYTSKTATLKLWRMSKVQPSLDTLQGKCDHHTNFGLHRTSGSAMTVSMICLRCWIMDQI